MNTCSVLDNTTANLTTVAAPIGNYVRYKGEVYVIVDFNENCSRFTILSPTLGKLSVSCRNLSALDHWCDVVEFRGSKYLVTKTNVIISLTTRRVMKWDDSHKERRAILAAR